jgi:hypothetical protein
MTKPNGHAIRKVSARQNMCIVAHGVGSGASVPKCYHYLRMFRNFLYAITGLAAIILIFLIVIDGGKFEKTPERQEKKELQIADASTSTPMPASLSPISAASIGEKNTITQMQPRYGVRTKTSGCVANQALPDPACSSGAVLTTDTSVICVSGYTQKVRDVPLSEKEQVFAEYGIDWSLHSGYEVDHIVSLELGGSNDLSNLYPESYSIQYGARIKDKLENHLHNEVCAGRLRVAVAQQQIATDWLKYYLAWQADTAPSSLSSSASAQNNSSTTFAASSSIYYTSSYGSAKYFYPAYCNAWKGLSPTYLMSFSSLEALLAKYPTRTLSPQC